MTKVMNGIEVEPSTATTTSRLYETTHRMALLRNIENPRSYLYLLLMSM
jgi:hypothetical protein